VARIAGGLYVLSIFLPFLSDRLSFAIYQPPSGREAVALNLPIDLEVFILAGEGTLVGPAQTAAGAETAAKGVAFGLLDLLFAPLLWVALPITGVILTVLPLVLGGVFLLGYEKHTMLLGSIYVATVTGYNLMLALKSVGFAPHLGAFMCLIASVILYALGVDRHFQLGFVTDNHYSE
jgi:hypothetical protein